MPGDELGDALASALEDVRQAAVLLDPAASPSEAPASDWHEAGQREPDIRRPTSLEAQLAESFAAADGGASIGRLDFRKAVALSAEERSALMSDAIFDETEELGSPSDDPPSVDLPTGRASPTDAASLEVMEPAVPAGTLDGLDGTTPAAGLFVPSVLAPAEPGAGSSEAPTSLASELASTAESFRVPRLAVPTSGIRTISGIHWLADAAYVPVHIAARLLRRAGRSVGNAGQAVSHRASEAAHAVGRPVRRTTADPTVAAGAGSADFAQGETDRLGAPARADTRAPAWPARLAGSRMAPAPPRSDNRGTATPRLSGHDAPSPVPNGYEAAMPIASSNDAAMPVANGNGTEATRPPGDIGAVATSPAGGDEAVLAQQGVLIRLALLPLRAVARLDAVGVAALLFALTGIVLAVGLVIRG